LLASAAATLFRAERATPRTPPGAGEVNVFSRFKERDPYRLLGVSKEARAQRLRRCAATQPRARSRRQRRICR
jgi:hypothetical protein